MVSQTVDKILTYEKLAVEKIEAAKKQAEEMVLSASKEAKSMVEDSLKEATIEAQKRSQANQADIDVLLEKARQASLQEVSELRTKTENKVDKATDTVIDFIMNRNTPTQG